MKVRTGSYELVHGRKPGGYGMWVFDINGHIKMFGGIFRVSLKMAKLFAMGCLKDRNAVINVLP